MLESSTLSTEHFARLENGYRSVGDATWANDDFLESNIAVSRSLYTQESLLAGRPRPKQLEVVALVAGIPFRAEFVDALLGVQRDLSAILDSLMHYWVLPENLGVEFCVFKWPDDSWNLEWLTQIQDVLGEIRQPSFRFEIRGVQINPDGCVVARGFDEGAVLFEIRREIRAKLSFLPVKQSGWAHVPLGRILEPVGAEKFGRLSRVVQAMGDVTIAATEIDEMKLVHETRWYMEEKTVLSRHPLAGV